MLEAAILRQFMLHEYIEASVIGVLLVFNAALGFVQEGRAQETLAALKTRLAPVAVALREGRWETIDASELVPGDIVKLSLGSVVPADVQLIEGELLLDQSMLTGEALPVERKPGTRTYAGALRNEGFRTANLTLPFQVLRDLSRGAIAMASPTRFELVLPP